MEEVFTSADTKAQEVYIKSLRECFPDHAIIAEEGDVASLPDRSGPAS
jgi:fructose-1,6-bisphosphatase/inositol monophosphatase family enzyme